jgi:hypothetical protein
MATIVSGSPRERLVAIRRMTMPTTATTRLGYGRPGPGGEALVEQ